MLQHPRPDFFHFQFIIASPIIIILVGHQIRPASSPLPRRGSAAMEGYDREFWQFSDQLRLQNNFSNLSIADSIWSSSTSPNSPLPDQSLNNASSWKPATANAPGLIGSGSKLAFGNATTTNADRYNYFPAAGAPDAKSNTNNSGGLAFSKGVNGPAAGLGNDYYFSKSVGALNANTNAGGDVIKSYFNKSVGRAASNNSNSNSGFGAGKKNAAAHDKKKSAGSGNGNGASVDKRFKSLPASEALPRGEAIGGYIFVCNNDTMEENLKRQLFGTPSYLLRARIRLDWIDSSIQH